MTIVSTPIVQQGEGESSWLDTVDHFVDISLLIAAGTTLEAARAALRIGFRPVPIYAIGETVNTKHGPKTSTGKEPIGSSWGEREWTDEGLDSTFGQNAGRNVGLLMGPEGGIIDIEMDRPADMDVETFERLADDELAELCGGEIPETVGWRSHRGVHRIFLWDDRLAVCAEFTKNAFHHGRLEIRLGAGKQIQSVIPPSRHANGERSWLTESQTITRLPDVAIERIIEAAKPKPKEVKPPAPAPVRNDSTGHPSERLDGEEIRLLGMARKLAGNILRANKGDADTGRHPTALASARTMAGLIAGHCRDDLAGACRSILIEAYRDSKPELSRDDPEFEQCIGDGWNDGTAEPLKLDEREPAHSSSDRSPAADDGAKRTPKPEVRLPLNFNDPSKIFRQIIPHLADAGVYYRDGSLCRIVRGDSVNIRGVGKLSVSGPAIDAHDVDSLLPALCQSIDFQAERMTKKGADFYPATPKPTLIRQLIRLRDWPGTPYLAGIASGPFLRHDGSVCTTPGYDAASGWYLDYNGEPIDIPESPTKAQAEDACRTLLALVEDFEWKSEAQRCGWLAYLLTLIARPGIEGNVPAFVFTASTKGAGKTLQVNVANIIAFGHPASGYSPPQGRSENESAEEWRKMLFAFALAGNPSLVVSNCPSGTPLGNAAIDQVLTESKVTGRTLGKSQVKDAAWVATVAFTGNNLSSSSDFSDRAIWAVLEPSVENPRKRIPPAGFTYPDLEEHAREHRASLLRKALIILRWHAVNGKPKAGGEGTGSFEQWASTVRDAVKHLTGHDVKTNGCDAEIADQESDELGMLMNGLREYCYWRRSFPDKKESFTVSELHGDLNANANGTSWSDLREVIDASLGVRQFCTSVGKLLSKYKGKVSGDMKLIVKTVNEKHYWGIGPVREKVVGKGGSG